MTVKRYFIACLVIAIVFSASVLAVPLADTISRWSSTGGSTSETSATSTSLPTPVSGRVHPEVEAPSPPTAPTPPTPPPKKSPPIRIGGFSPSDPFDGSEIHVPADYATIQWAVGNASDGDRIIVHAGTYEENVVIVNKTLLLTAYGSDVPLVVGNGGVCFNATSMEYDDVSISGFEMRNCTFGVLFEGVADAWVNNNVIREFSVMGISTVPTTVYGDVQCNGNVIISAENGVDGIRIHDVYGDVEANNNIIVLTGSGTYGIHVDEVYGDVQCNGNMISTLGTTPCSWGIYFVSIYNDVQVRNNDIKSYYDAIRVSNLVYGDMEVVGNTIYSSDTEGVHIWVVYGKTYVNDNEIDAYNDGIYIDEGYCDIQVNGNTILSRNDQGIYIYDGYAHVETNGNTIQSDDEGIYVEDYAYAGFKANDNVITSWWSDGIYVGASYAYFVVCNNRIDSYDEGVYLSSEAYSYAIVNDNLIYSRDCDGIYIWKAYGVEVKRNFIYSYDEGIYVYYSYAITDINDNNIQSEWNYGIYLYESYSDLYINNNNITSYDEGIYVDYGYSTVSMCNNYIRSLDNYGIYLYEACANTTINNNTIWAYNEGLYIYEYVYGDLEIVGNFIGSEWNEAIYIGYPYDYDIYGSLTINNNTIRSNNDYGIYVGEYVHGDVQINYNNISSYCDAIYLNEDVYGNVEILHNNIDASLYGGDHAIYFSRSIYGSVEISHNTIKAAKWVGYSSYGIYISTVYGDTTIEDNEIGCYYGIYINWAGNDVTITNNNITADDTGIYIDTYGDIVIANNMITNPETYGIEIGGAYGTCDITENTMSVRPGAVGIYIIGYVYGKTTILRNVVDPGALAGIYINVYIGPHSLIAHNTIYLAHDYGIFLEGGVPSTVQVRNNIVYGMNKTGSFGILGGVSGPVGWNDVYNFRTLGTWNATYGDISLDPKFVDPFAGDFHLQAASLCIDAGINIGLPYAGTAPDMGAYEYGTPHAPAPIPPTGTTWYVAPTVPPGNYTKIQDAVDAASDGDRIIVYAGTYNESVVIVNKTLTLMAYGTDVPLVNGTGGNYCFNVTSNEYDDISIIGLNMTTDGTYAIYIVENANVNVTGNIISLQSSGSYGIHIDTVVFVTYGDVEVCGNTITSSMNSVYGIYAHDVQGNVKIDSNHINLTGTSTYGIHVGDVYGDTQLNENVVSALGDSSYGVYLGDLYGDCQANDNNIESYNEFYVQWTAGEMEAIGNTINSTNSYGIYLNSIDGKTYANENTVDSDNEGIYAVTGYGDIQIIGNTINSTGSSGVYIDYGRAHAEVNGNTINCSSDAIFVGEAYGGFKANENTITSQNGIGIDVSWSGGCVIVNDNNITSYNEGIEISDADNYLWINGNTINSTAYASGIYIGSCGYGAEVKNNKIVQSYDDGIYIDLQAGPAYVGNNFVNSTSGYGIYLNDACGPAIIEDNEVYSHEDGILTDYIYSTLVIRNNFVVSANSYGIDLDEDIYSNLTITGNNITSSQEGIFMGFEVYGDVVITGNNITSIGSDGIYVNDYIGSLTINLNTITAYNYGIYIRPELYGDVKINENTITSFYTAIYIHDKVYGNLQINDNNIVRTRYGGIYTYYGAIYGTAEISGNTIATSLGGTGDGIQLLGNLYSDATMSRNNITTTVGYLGRGINTNYIYGDLWINENNITAEDGIVISRGYGDATTNGNNINTTYRFGILYGTLHGALEIKENVIHLPSFGTGIYISNTVYGKATILRNVIDPNFYAGIWFGEYGKKWIGSHSLIAHNTIYQANDYGIYIDPAVPETIAVKNNIIVGTSNATTIGIYGGVSGNCTKGVGYNDLWTCNLTLSTYNPAYGDISADPMFADPTEGDFRLQEGSPCIDAGIDIGLPYEGLAPDMGAYEGAVAPPPPPILDLLLDLRKEIAVDLPTAYIVPPGYLRSRLLYYADQAIERYLAGDRFMTIARLQALRVRITEHVLNAPQPWRTTLTNKIDLIISLL